VSSDGQRAPEARSGTETLVVKTFPMVAGTTFDRHSHDDHQLAWATRGVLTVRTDDATWVLPPTRALWIPAGVRHVTAASRAATMQTVYLHPGRCPVDWAAPTPVGVGALLAELIAHLGDSHLDPARRARAEGVLIDLLQPLHVATIELRMPRDPRALDVAAALVREPASKRTLGQWGHEVGASERTLARAFQAETGVSFGRWRTQLRLQAALPTLAEGGSVASASDTAGYESSSAFVAAFRRETGMTPAEYFRL
jgi:AraC-like DNA-binding protein